MTNVTDSFHKAAALVKKWGHSCLPDGRTVNDLLTIDGISLWNAISPMLALSHISKVISQPAQVSIVGRYGRKIANEAKKVKFDCNRRISSSPVGCDGWPKGNTFLCLGFSHYIYRETLQPIAVRLANRPQLSVVVMDDIFSFQLRMMEHSDVMFQSLWQHGSSGINQSIRKLRKTLRSVTSQLTAQSGLKRIVESSGLIWSDVKHIFDWLFHGYFPQLVAYVAIAKHIVTHHRPSLLISPDVNDPRTRIFCLLGKLEGIKTLEIQFSFYGINDIEWRFFIADHLAVTGDQNIQLMLDHGIALNKMSVTGSARYDSTLSWTSDLVQITRQKLCASESNVLVLFASQPYYYGSFSSSEIRHQMILDLFKAASETPGIQLIVKPHPLEKQNELFSLARGIKNILFADKHLDIRDLIKATDTFITFYSNSTFDALVMNKPTINLAYPGGYPLDLFEKSGATFVAENKQEIYGLLQSISNGSLAKLHTCLTPARESFLNHWFYHLDGCAAERIESIALKMASLKSAVV